jgi:hypothetical protein
MKAWACLVCPDCSGTGLRKMPKGKEARERIVDLRVPGVSCLTLVDDLQAKIGQMPILAIGSAHRPACASSPCGQCRRT